MINNKVFEERLPSSDYYFRLFDQLPSLMWRSGRDAKRDWFNSKWLGFTGRTMEQETGDGWVENIHTDDYDQCIKIHLDHFNARLPFETDYRLKHHSGVYRWIRDIGQPFKDEHGNFAGFLGTCYDIHEGKEAELRVTHLNKVLEEKVNLRTQEAERGRQELNLIINAIPDLISYIDKSYVYQYCNGAYNVWFDLEGVDIKGKPMAEILGEEAFSVLKPLVDKALSGDFVGFETSVHYKNGTRNISGKYIPDKDREGNVRGIIVLVTDITAATQAQESLKLQARVLESMNEGVAVSDENGFIIYTNPAEDRMFGYGPGELLSEHVTVQNAYPPEENKKKVEEVIRELKSSGFWSGVWNSIRKDGSHFLTHSHISSLNVGERNLYVSVQYDITESERIKAELKESETRFRALADDAPAFIFIAGKNAEVEFLNKTWLSFTGLSLEEYTGRKSLELIHPEDLTLVESTYNDAFENQKPYTFEIRQKGADGKYRWILWKGIPRFVANQFVGMMSVGIDIDERKNAEQELQESEYGYRTLIEEATVATALYLGPEIRIRYANDLMLAYWGKDKSVIGKTFRKALPELEGQPFPEILEEVYKSGKSYTGMEELAELVVNGKMQPFYFNFTYKPLRNQNGQIYGIHHMAVDVTREVVTKKELKLKNELLTRINNDLDNFIYTASHDLKAPMSNIEGLLHSLRDNLDLGKNKINEETELLLELMQKSVNRFKTTILDLTEISKVQKVEEEDVSEVNLRELIEDVKLSIQDKIAESKAEIITGTFQSQTVLFSKKNLKSIVYNILSNAIKYRDPHRVPQVWVETQENENYTVLLFKDNGLGIKEENKGKIFSMFKRFHDHVEGTGIGLYIVKRIIDNAGGKIEVESELGKGTIFKVYVKKIS